jgi:hypothetical protein
MASHRISVRRILELGVLVTWQEAVAVVHEVAILSVVNASRNGVPSRVDADSCILTRRGDVELPQTTDQARPDAPLQLLRELLTGRETPADLESLAYGTASDNLTDDLAMFSRPNRRSEIANLAMRALDAEQEMARLGITPPAHVDGVPPTPPPVPEVAPTTSPLVAPAVSAPAPSPLTADAELAKLRDQVSTSPTLPAAEPAPPTARVPPWARRAAAAAVLVGVTATAWWTWSVSPPAPPEPPALAATPSALGPVELDPSWHTAGRRDADVELGLPPAAPSAPVATTAVPAAGLVPGTTPAPSDGLGSDTAPAVALNGAAASTDDVEVSDPAIDALFADDSVYTSTNSAVRPPLMMFPRMPRSAFPGPGDEVDGAYFEVLVDQRGGVEAVRLRGREQPGQTFYRARMMLSAAKAWQFQPAQLDGRPVRYVVRVVPEQ